MPHAVEARLNYFLPPPDGPPYELSLHTVGSRRNMKYNSQRVEIEDIRDRIDDFRIDEYGFEYTNHPSMEKDFAEDGDWQEGYLEECREIVKKITGASVVKPFNHVIRKALFEDCIEAEKDMNDNESVKQLSTARFVHTDFSTKGAKFHRNYHLTSAEQTQFTNTRWAILNLWRPIGRTVTREPLCFCAAKSVPDADLCEVLSVAPKRPDGSSVRPDVLTYQVTAGGVGTHRWYFASDMTPEEVVVFKQFDSEEGKGVAGRTPHCAFTSEGDWGPPRMSIEVRVLVFWEDQREE